MAGLHYSLEQLLQYPGRPHDQAALIAAWHCLLETHALLSLLHAGAIAPHTPDARIISSSKELHNALVAAEDAQIVAVVAQVLELFECVLDWVELASIGESPTTKEHLASEQHEVARLLSILMDIATTSSESSTESHLS